mgnify:CR=1 FL=1
MELTDKTVLITGSSRGIGAQTALAFAQKGSRVILNARHPITTELIDEIKYYQVDCRVVLGDISDPAAVKKMLAEIYGTGQKIDILVNNAGITNDKLLIGMTNENFRRVINTNLIGTFDLSRQVLKKMYRQKSGVIVNLTSVVGLHGNLGHANYAASKAGIIVLTKTIAQEWALRNIRCNAVAPVMLQSPMTADLNQKVK